MTTICLRSEVQVPISPGEKLVELDYQKKLDSEMLKVQVLPHLFPSNIAIFLASGLQIVKTANTKSANNEGNL